MLSVSLNHENRVHEMRARTRCYRRIHFSACDAAATFQRTSLICHRPRAMRQSLSLFRVTLVLCNRQREIYQLGSFIYAVNILAAECLQFQKNHIGSQFRKYLIRYNQPT